MKLNNMASRQAFLRELSTAELDGMLQAELRKETIDDDLVRIILIVLEEREMEYPVEIDDDISAAAERLEESLANRTGTPKKTRWPHGIIAASLLLVIGLLMFAAPQVAHAENFFGMLARWTESVFEFFNPTDERRTQPEYVFETDHPGLRQIHDAVVELGVTDPVVPMWVPNGYELVECRTTIHLKEKSTHAILSNGKNTIVIHLSVIDNENDVETYKDKSTVNTYEFNDTVHYLTNNLNRQIANWNTSAAVCSISVDCQENILFEILKSIYMVEED